VTDQRDLQSIAESVGAHIAEGDLLAKGLGVRLVEIAPGRATAVMTVRPDMSNAAGVCHGGATFTLADTAFGFACNAHDRLALAQTCTITYTGAARIGNELTAVAEEVALVRRSGIYDVTVTDQNGKVVAVFRGQSRQIKGQPTIGAGSFTP